MLTYENTHTGHWGWWTQPAGKHLSGPEREQQLHERSSESSLDLGREKTGGGSELYNYIIGIMTAHSYLSDS